MHLILQSLSLRCAQQSGDPHPHPKASQRQQQEGKQAPCLPQPQLLLKPTQKSGADHLLWDWDRPRAPRPCMAVTGHRS
jgi:hypothetical protein